MVSFGTGVAPEAVGPTSACCHIYTEQMGRPQEMVFLRLNIQHAALYRMRMTSTSCDSSCSTLDSRSEVSSPTWSDEKFLGNMLTRGNTNPNPDANPRHTQEPLGERGCKVFSRQREAPI